MVHADDPVREGYVASLARPGGNITGGTFSFAPEALGEIVGGKAIELLAECRPGLSRLALLLDPNFPSSRTFSLSYQALARKRGMAVQAVEVREAGELARAFARMVMLTGWRRSHHEYPRGMAPSRRLLHMPGGKGRRRGVFFPTARVSKGRGTEPPSMSTRS
jgi:hypothetical protein